MNYLQPIGTQYNQNKFHLFNRIFVRYTRVYFIEKLVRLMISKLRIFIFFIRFDFNKLILISYIRLIILNNDFNK